MLLPRWLMEPRSCLIYTYSLVLSRPHPPFLCIVSISVASVCTVVVFFVLFFVFCFVWEGLPPHELYRKKKSFIRFQITMDDQSTFWNEDLDWTALRVCSDV